MKIPSLAEESCYPLGTCCPSFNKLQDEVSQPYTITVLGGIIFVSGGCPVL